MQGWEEATKEVQVLRNALAVTRFVLGDTVSLSLSLSLSVIWLGSETQCLSLSGCVCEHVLVLHADAGCVGSMSGFMCSMSVCVSVSLCTASVSLCVHVCDPPLHTHTHTHTHARARARNLKPKHLSSTRLSRQAKSAHGQCVTRSTRLCIRSPPFFLYR
jgi:hypothetical protein